MRPTTLPPDQQTSLDVLHIEDNPADTLLVRAHLEDGLGEQSVALTSAASMAEGLRQLRAVHFDVALLDLSLPDSQGVASLKRLRQAAPGLPIIVLTGLEDDGTAVEALRCGAQDYLPKAQAGSWMLGHAIRYAIERQRLRDILDEKLLQVAASEDVVRTVFAAQTDAVVLTDDEGLVLLANPAAGALLGCAPEDLVGHPLALQTPTNGHPETTATAPDGSERVLEVRSVKLDWDGQPARLASFRDVTEQRALTRQLEQSQKLEAIARLTGGIAHDFNNLLTVINGCTELLLGQDAENVDPTALLQEIARAGDRAARLTRHLLAFSRHAPTVPVVLDLHETLAGLLPLLERLIGEDVRVLLSRCDEPCLVHIDPSHVEQVVMNLAVNARDAMHHGGELRLATSVVRLEGACLPPGRVPGAYVRLQVSDTGSGMDEATLEHIFEPFYTTKPVGQGTGLGLSTALGVIQLAGGSIDVISSPEQGTTVSVDLPRHDGPVTPEPEPESASPAAPGHETILVAEDEAGVRQVVVTVLQSAGYTVLAAADGRAAAELLSDPSAPPIDLLLTDVLMPQLGGPQLAELALQRHPDLAIVFMSGHADDAVLRAGLDLAGTALVDKPFTPAVLRRAVRQALDDLQRGRRRTSP